MKRAILETCILACALCAVPSRAERTPEQFASDLFALTNRILRLEHGDDTLKAIPAWAAREGLSRDDVSVALVAAARSLRGSGPDSDRIRHRALDALAFHGTTNAIPFLASVVREESGTTFDEALNAWVVLTEADEREIAAIHRIVTEDRRDDPGPLYGFYREMAQALKWRTIDPKRAASVRSLLLATAASNAAWADVADGILCEHVAGYAGSAQRRANLARALGDPSLPAGQKSRIEQTAADASTRHPVEAETTPDPSVDFGPRHPASDEPPLE